MNPHNNDSLMCVMALPKFCYLPTLALIFPNDDRPQWVIWRWLWAVQIRVENPEDPGAWNWKRIGVGNRQAMENLINLLGDIGHDVPPPPRQGRGGQGNVIPFKKKRRARK